MPKQQALYVVKMKQIILNSKTRGHYICIHLHLDSVLTLSHWRILFNYFNNTCLRQMLQMCLRLKGVYWVMGLLKLKHCGILLPNNRPCAVPYKFLSQEENGICFTLSVLCGPVQFTPYSSWTILMQTGTLCLRCHGGIIKAILTVSSFLTSILWP